VIQRPSSPRRIRRRRDEAGRGGLRSAHRHLDRGAIYQWALGRSITEVEIASPLAWLIDLMR